MIKLNVVVFIYIRDKIQHINFNINGVLENTKNWMRTFFMIFCRNLIGNEDIRIYLLPGECTVQVK